MVLLSVNTCYLFFFYINLIGISECSLEPNTFNVKSSSTISKTSAIVINSFHSNSQANITSHNEDGDGTANITKNTTMSNDDRSHNFTNDSSKLTSVTKKMKQTLRQKTEEFREKLINREKYFNNTLNGTLTEKWRRQKQSFLDKIAVISETLLNSDTANVKDEAGDDDEITQQSDLTIPNRSICVVTTASLPWMTGTAVNPLLRAAYLWRKSLQLRNNEIESSHQLSDDLIGTVNEKIDTLPEDDMEHERAHDLDIEHDKQLVTLVIPWLELEEDRAELYGQGSLFQNQFEQEQYIRKWMREKANLEDAADPEAGLKIIFYPARYHSDLGSVFAMGDICSYIDDKDADVCILEEPEHLNWYRAPGSGWTTKFNYVIGVVHTNYKEYASGHYSGLWTSPAIGFLSSAMVRAYCHKVIKLSDVLQTYAHEKEVTSNVHGVRSEFLDEGKRRARQYTARMNGSETDLNHFISPTDNEIVVYFIGKILWAKGFDRLLELEDFYKQCTGTYFAIDVYGSGPDEKVIKRAFHGRPIKSLIAIKDEKNETKKESETKIIGGGSDDSLNSDEIQGLAKIFDVSGFSGSIKTKTDSIEIDLPKSLYELRKKPIPAHFPGRVDHSLLNEQYKIFVNPSVSEVLCTTTAEALAMGKFVVIPVHPSNFFFMKFPNCLAYRDKMEFAASLRWALNHEPKPLTEELVHEFTWEAATERFIASAAITNFEARSRSKLGKSKIDERIAWFHNEIGKGVKGDVIRKVLGGGPVSDQVRYEMEKLEGFEVESESNHEVEYENFEEDQGLPVKLRASAFVKAMHSSVMRSLGQKKE